MATAGQVLVEIGMKAADGIIANFADRIKVKVAVAIPKKAEKLKKTKSEIEGEGTAKSGL